MNPEQFVYWLQGFAELTGDAAPTPEQWKSIREHLATVFHKVTPPVQVPKPADHGDSLQDMLRRANERNPLPPFQPHPYDLSPKCSVGGVVDGSASIAIC